MKKKIFDKMVEYGWTLEDFNNVYLEHWDFIDSCHEYIVGEEYDFTMQDISKKRFIPMVEFMSDFLRAIDDLDKGR